MRCSKLSRTGSEPAGTALKPVQSRDLQVLSKPSSSAMLILLPNLTVLFPAAQQTQLRSQGQAHGTGRGHRALPRAEEDRPNQTANRNICNPSGVSVCPGTDSGQSFPCFQQSCTNRTWFSCKNLSLCFQTHTSGATGRLLVHELGSKQMFACPAPCQQLLPKHRVFCAALLPSHLPLQSPSTGDKPASGKAWLAEKGLSLSWLVPVTITWCQGSVSAQAAVLHGQEAPSSIPISQQSLPRRNNSKPLCWRILPRGLVPSHLQVTRHRKMSLSWMPRGNPEFPFLLPSCGVVFPQMNSNPFLLF